MSETFSAESRLIHAGTDRTPGQPATPPLVPASIYVSAGPPRPGRAYGRESNPGWEALEQALGGLEDAEAVAFASGQAASMALMLALAPGRERIVLPTDGYYGGRVLADQLRPHGAVPVPVDLQDLAAVERELTAAPSVLWAETPTNPLLRVADLARLAELAAAAGAPMVVDNTVATGLLQRPLDCGRDGLAVLADQVGVRALRRDPRRRGQPRRRAAGRPAGLADPAAAASPGRSRPGWRCAGSRRCRCGSRASRTPRWPSPGTWPAIPRVAAVHYPGIDAIDVGGRPPADARRLRALAVLRGPAR